MTDLGTQFRASLDASRIILAVLKDAEEILQHGNDLFHTPGDVDVFLRTLAAATRVTRGLGDLDRLVRHSDEH